MGELYKLATDYQRLADEIDGMDEQTVIDTLEGSTELMAIEEKALNISKWMANLSSESDAYENEIKRLSDHKKAVDNKNKWLKQYLQTCMEVAGLQKIKAGTFSLTLQKNPPKLIVDDEKAIPASYLTIVPEHTEVNKAELKDALKNGNEIPGARLECGTSLRIR